MEKNLFYLKSSSKNFVKILIIEDSEFERKYLIDVLRKEGYTDVIEAECGKEGIAKFIGEKPDVVLLDLRLPDMWGVDVLKEIKNIDKNARVIVVSIVRDEQTIEEVKSLGVVDYIIKPVVDESKIRLLEAIKSCEIRKIEEAEK